MDNRKAGERGGGGKSALTNTAMLDNHQHTASASLTRFIAEP